MHYTCSLTTAQWLFWKATEAQERVDAAHHNVYNMHATGKAWLELVVRYDRSSHTLGRYM